MRFFSILLCAILFYAAPVFAQRRSFNDVFPDCDEAKREKVFSKNGLLVFAEDTVSLRLSPPIPAGTAIQKVIAEQRPFFLSESLLVIPFQKNVPDMLKIYNACGKVQKLQGRTYFSVTRDKEIPLFDEATRLESPRRNSAIPDPPDAQTVPSKETMYMRLKDANFGNSYYRADISVDQYGLTYSLTNFRNLTYLFIPAIRENKFVAHLYIEPLDEGILIYSVSGVDVSDLIASMINIPSAIRKRLEVIIEWIAEGIQAVSL
ncbi:MAG: hypothetical protein LBU18_03760 [Treponema sp.]|nr:hypothetical protein [Treponema sp.]